MSEEKYLQFSNNKDKYTWNTDGKINKNKFAEGSKIRKFLDIFDKNGDGIIEGKEIASLFGSLEISANKNGNSVFETKEAEEYLENTKDIDGKSLKEDGISVNELFGFVKTIMKKSQNSEIQNINIGETEYSYEETENIAIKNISKDVQSARELFRDQMSQSGSVSKFADWVKDIFGSDNVSYKIDETLAWEALSASLLEQAQTGDLTVRSYLEQKLQLAYALLPDPDEGLFGGLIDNLPKISAKELEKLGIKLNKNISKENKEKYIKAEILKKALENLKPEELEVYMINLSQASTDERAEISKQMTQDIVGEFLGSKEVSFSTTSGTKKQKVKNPQYDETKAQAAAKWNKEHPDSSAKLYYSIPKYIEIEVPNDVPSLIVGNPSNRDGSLGEIKNIQADKLKTFEETFYDERGVRYDPQSIMDYEQKNAGTQFLVQMHNTIQNLKLSIYKASSKVDANIHNHTGLEYPEDSFKLNQVLCNNLSILYNGDTEKIQEFITSVLGENVTIEETISNKNFKTREIKYATNAQLVKLGNAIVEMMEKNYQKALGGKTLEQHAQETKNAYEKAYGHNNILDKVNEYIESQQESVGNIHTAITVGSMICMIGGQLIPVGGQAGAALIAAGMTGATLGSPMLEFAEKVTSEAGISKEELKDIGIEIVQNAAMLAAGIKSGQISSKAYLSMVAQKMPKLIAFAGEVGIDSTIGILSTLAITGELDITGEGISQIQAFLVGLAHSKFKMGRFFDTHAGDVHTKRSNEETSHTKTNDDTKIKSTDSDIKTSKVNEESEKIAKGKGKGKTKSNNNKTETKISDEEIIQSIQILRQQYLDSKKTLDKIFDDSGLNNLEGLERFESRVKSESSLRDKIRNYLKDNPNATIEEALTAEIRDAYGARTILKTDIDYTNHPEVKALLEAGDERGAMLKAAELQSAPAVKQLKRMIDMIASGEADFEITRITNYVSKDGIPYFSENQLADIAWYAAKKGIKGFDQVIRIENNKAIDAKGKNITKSQPSGYSALQMNIKTKDGKVLEWQMRGKDVNDFAEGEHIPYDLRTGKNILGDHPELEPLYKPLQKLLCGTGEEKIGKMPDEAYNEYNRYLDDYYTYLRKKELGFKADEPKLSEYGNGYKFDEKLDAQNLMKLHKIAQDVKNKKITIEKALKDYEYAITQKKFDNLIDKYKDNPLQMLEDINVGETIQKAQTQGRQDVIDLINKAYNLSIEPEKQLKAILDENTELKRIYNSDRKSKIIIDKIFEAEYDAKYDPETGEKLTGKTKINHIKKVLNENLDDIKKDIKFRDIKSKLDSNVVSSAEKANIYKKYLDEEFGKNTTGKYANVRKLCEKIDNEFGVKIILPANTQEAGVALKLIYQELSNFRMHAAQDGETAKFPQTMRFSHISYDGFIKGNAAGVALRNKFDNSWEDINLDGLNIENVKYTLRHELTHVNDKLDTYEFPQDIDVKKYAQEFLNAGIDVEHIPYAYKNRKEFISVASEGDMRAYSDEFKEVLKKLGMPEWMMTMQNMRLSNKPVTQYETLRLKELMDNLEVGNKDTNTEINVPYKTNNKFLTKKQPYKLDLKNLPVLELPNGQIINLNNYASAIYKLHEGQKIIIGREGNIKINDPSGKVSRNHIVIYKQNGVIKLQDISTNGTKIVEKYSKYNGNTSHNQYYNTSAYPKITTPEKYPQQLIKGQKYLLEPYTNPNTSITLGGVISVDVNSNLFRKMFFDLKEGEEFTVGSWEGNADYKIGSNYIGVSRIHLVVRKENGKMVIVDKSSLGSAVINNHCDPVTPKDVKKMFGGGIFTKGSLTPTYLLSQVYNHLQVNKENFFDLDKEDYRIIAELMNKENGKYIHIWNATSKTDQMRNIEKLAIMVKVLRATGAVNDFINLGPNEWELVVNGCCNKTRFAIDSILDYKQNSNFMNKILSGDNYNIEKYGPYINRLTTFLNMQVINKKVRLYRGEGYNGVLSLVKTKNGVPIGKAMENLIKKGASNYEIMKFIDEELMGLNVTQERFMSTTLTKEFAQNWAQNGSMGSDATYGCIRWDIYAPAGTKGAFVEDLNLFYDKENEVLIQRNSTLAITNVRFDWSTKTWVIEATIVQNKIPQ